MTAPLRTIARQLSQVLHRVRGDLYLGACDAAMVLVDGRPDRRLTSDDCAVAAELMQLLQSRAWHPDTPPGIEPFELVAVVERVLGRAPCQPVDQGDPSCDDS